MGKAGECGLVMIVRAYLDHRDFRSPVSVVDNDYTRGELLQMAEFLLTGDRDRCPDDFETTEMEYLLSLDGSDRLAAAGAMIAAEIDRLRRVVG